MAQQIQEAGEDYPPGFHHFVRAVKMKKSSTENRIHNARLGEAPSCRRRKYRKLDERLQRVKDLLQGGELTTSQFLSAASPTHRSSLYLKLYKCWLIKDSSLQYHLLRNWWDNDDWWWNCMNTETVSIECVNKLLCVLKCHSEVKQLVAW